MHERTVGQVFDDALEAARANVGGVDFSGEVRRETRPAVTRKKARVFGIGGHTGRRRSARVRPTATYPSATAVAIPMMVSAMPLLA